MSVDRYFRWGCNTCLAVEEREGYGLPKGWHWRHNFKTGILEHGCPVCVAAAGPDAGYRNDSGMKKKPSV